MPRSTLTTLTPDLMARMERLRVHLVRGDTPPAIAYVRERLDQATANARRLQILFGGQIDQGSVEEVVFWKMELDSAYLRAAQEG